jgi:hypothetical protein
MDITEFLQLLPGLALRRVPMLTVVFVGLWFAISRRQKLGRVSTWAAWGFSLLIAHVLANASVVYLTIQPGAMRGGIEINVISLIGLLALSSQLMFIGGLAVLARAVFLDRNAGAVSQVSDIPLHALRQH